MSYPKCFKTRLCAALAAGLFASSMAAADATVTISATPNPTTVGSVVGVDILISGVTDLYGYQFSLGFNSSVLQAVSSTEGAFLGTGGSTFFDGGSIDNGTGNISFVFDTLVGAVPGVNGGGVLAHVNFNAVGAGTNVFAFSDGIFLDSALADITTTFQPGTVLVTAVPEPAAYALFAFGLAGIGLVARRRKAA
ncbi:MAG TPA: cohesin domain-containing protein [Burkholderiaceae bacterium]